MNGERQLHSACQVSCGQPLWQSPSSPHQFSLDVAALFALSMVVSCQVARAGCIRACGGRSPTRNLRAGPLQMRYRQIYIVALAQIRPPHCTISCLASRSAIIFSSILTLVCVCVCVCVWGGGGGGGGGGGH